jgi:hypothetical protein
MGLFTSLGNRHQEEITAWSSRSFARIRSNSLIRVKQEEVLLLVGHEVHMEQYEDCGCPHAPSRTAMGGMQFNLVLYELILTRYFV